MRKPLTNDAGEVRELTTSDLRTLRSASQVLPSELVGILPPAGAAPNESSRTVKVTIDLDRETVERFRAGGPGWKARINSVLKKVAV